MNVAELPPSQVPVEQHVTNLALNSVFAYAGVAEAKGAWDLWQYQRAASKRIADAESGPNTGSVAADGPQPLPQVTQPQRSTTHGNSATSTKPQHGYVVFETQSGDVVKTGISGEPLNRNGTSPRANAQINVLKKVEGAGKYSASVVTTNLADRAAALQWERANAQWLWDQGNSMRLHQRPRPWD